MSGVGPVPLGSAGQRGQVLLPALGLVALAVPFLIALGFISLNVGGDAVLVGAMAAVLPVLPVVVVFLWVDRWEPEPPRLLFVPLGRGNLGARRDDRQRHRDSVR